MTNIFSADITYSNKHKNFWKLAYHKAFRLTKNIEDKSQDMKAQALGIDTIIHLPFGGEIFIDEKMRRKNYGDILIEYISNDQKNTKGWVEKELKIDFIGYAIEDSREVFFIPFKELQKLWFSNKEEWIKRYKTKQAKNEFYNTLNCPVPLHELKSLRIIYVKI
jgi:hypothetical protein